MKLNFYRTLFVVFLFAEMLLCTAQRHRYFGSRENGVVVLVLTAVMGLVAFLAAFERWPGRAAVQRFVREQRAMQLLALLGLVLCGYHFQREISVIPIDVRLSDVLPTIQVMDRRLLQGEYPYQLITEFGYDLSPTYLPMMWLPFLPAAVAGFDERWVGFGIWALAVLALLWRVQRSQGLRPEQQWLLTALPFFLFVLIEEGTDAVFGNTVEIMIAGFYLLFALQLHKIRHYLQAADPRRAGLWIALPLLCCLLSRYSFVLWLPLCFVFLWWQNRRLALLTALYCAVGVLLLFGLPFLVKDPALYFKGLAYYSKAALGEWAQAGRQGHLYDGLGVAGWFRDEAPGEMPQRLAALQRWHLLASLGAVLFCAALGWLRRAKLQNPALFLLGSLKFYFAFFYAFIQVPYVYLHLTPCFLSIALLFALYEESSEHPNFTP
jgi:hypothetical protein